MRRAFVVEDRKYVRELIVAFINHTKKFSHVDEAESGEGALAIFKPGVYGLVVIDIGLINMTGLDVCIEMRKLDPDTTIFAISGHVDLLKNNDFSIAGFDAWFTKPTGYKDFFDAVRDL